MLREFLHVAAHFLGGNLRIDLRRADATVAQHLRERFDRHVVRQADRRGIGMAGGMESDMLCKEKQIEED